MISFVVVVLLFTRLPGLLSVIVDLEVSDLDVDDKILLQKLPRDLRFSKALTKSGLQSTRFPTKITTLASRMYHWSMDIDVQSVMA